MVIRVYSGDLDDAGKEKEKTMLNEQELLKEIVRLKEVEKMPYWKMAIHFRDKHNLQISSSTLNRRYLEGAAKEEAAGPSEPTDEMSELHEVNLAIKARRLGIPIDEFRKLCAVEEAKRTIDELHGHNTKPQKETDKKNPREDAARTFAMTAIANGLRMKDASRRSTRAASPTNPPYSANQQGRQVMRRARRCKVSQEVLVTALGLRLAGSSYDAIAASFPDRFNRESIRRPLLEKIQEHLRMVKDTNASGILTNGRLLTSEEIAVIKDQLGKGKTLDSISEDTRVDKHAIITLLIRMGFPSASFEPENFRLVSGPRGTRSANRPEPRRAGTRQHTVRVPKCLRDYCEDLRLAGKGYSEIVSLTHLPMHIVRRVLEDAGLNTKKIRSTIERHVARAGSKENSEPSVARPDEMGEQLVLPVGKVAEDQGEEQDKDNVSVATM